MNWVGSVSGSRVRLAEVCCVCTAVLSSSVMHVLLECVFDSDVCDLFRADDDLQFDPNSFMQTMQKMFGE